MRNTRTRKEYYLTIISKYLVLRNVGISEPQQEIVLRYKNKDLFVLCRDRSLVGMYKLLESIFLELIEQALDFKEKD